MSSTYAKSEVGDGPGGARSFLPHLRGSESSRRPELWSLHDNNAADEVQARLFVIDDPWVEYLESKPVATMINDELGSTENTTNKSKPIWAIWATMSGSMFEGGERRERMGACQT